MEQEPGKFRCPWCLGFEDYVKYHDEEWGVPVFDDQKQFEFLVLESAQAGLSWSTILKKRAGYRKAFTEFDYVIVADLPDGYVQELLLDTGIIRNEMKIRAAINNAKRFMEIQASHGSFKNYIWDFVDGKPVQNQWRSLSEVPATSQVSDKLAKDIKSKGFKFLGSTILYAHMQATGLVNDHLVDCFRYEEVKSLGK
jgi:DNA-3-methyladenine glycosylase I